MRWTTQRKDREQEENRKRTFNDGWMCVCMSVRARREVYKESEVCEGAIKALYYKSLTVHVCVEITEGCLSPFRLCQDDICIPFFLSVKY